MKKPGRFSHEEKVYAVVPKTLYTSTCELLSGKVAYAFGREGYSIRIPSTARSIYAGTRIRVLHRDVFPHTKEGKACAQKLLIKYCRREIKTLRATEKLLSETIARNSYTE